MSFVLALVIANVSAGVALGDDEVFPIDKTEEIQHAVKAGTLPTVQCGDDIQQLGSPPNKNNLVLHPCPQKAKGENAYLPDLFAATCTCPTADQSLKEIRASTEKPRELLKKERKKAVDALVKSPVVKAEFDALVSKACAECSTLLGGNFNALANCLWTKSSNGMIMSEERAFFAIDARLVISHAKASAGWVPKSPDSVTGFSSEFAPVDPPLTQNQCEKLGVYSERGFAGELLRDKSAGILKKPGDQSPVPLGMTKREVSEAMMTATEGAHQQIVDGMQSKASLEKGKALLKPLLEKAKDWLEKSIRADAPTSEKCAAMKKFGEQIHCNEAVIGVEGVVRRARDQLDKISVVQSNSLDSLDSIAASYQPKTQEMRISPAVLSLAAKHPELTNFVIAHELGHAIMQSLTEQFQVKEKDVGLFGCLRSKASVEATAEPDQLDDAFADWFATELLAEKLGSSPKAAKAYLSEGKALCEGGATEQSDDAKDDHHPAGPYRLNKIIAAHPSLRAALGETKLPAAADGKSAEPLVYCQPPAGLGLNFNIWAKETVNDL